MKYIEEFIFNERKGLVNFISKNKSGMKKNIQNFSDAELRQAAQKIISKKRNNILVNGKRNTII